MDQATFQGIFYTDISDHYPVFSVSIGSDRMESTSYEHRRAYKEHKLDVFCDKISDIDWSSVMNIMDCNLAYSMFNSVFLNCYNQCFPIRKVKVTYKNRKRWLTEGLKKSIKVKNKLYVRSIKRPTLHNVRRYKDYKHKLKYLLRKSEKEHYDSLMRRYQSNVKKSWGVIKEVINRNKVKKCNDTFLINGHEESDIKKICNAFNNFYVNVGPSLASKIPASINDPCDYINYDGQSLLHFDPVDCHEVLEYHIPA